ncbi:hypothetical protein CP532_6399, partial [Ophiocordyceps camponoti-leonardi (nom. inval.)]
CTSRPFKRRADLDRHYKHRHAPDSVKDSFICDYPRCSRHQDPFHRLDHFRDHLRECLKRVHHADACPRCKTPSNQPKKRKDSSGNNASHVTRQR